MNTDKITEAITISLMGIGLVLMIGLLYAYPVMWLWNWLITDIFTLRSISVTEALGLVVLSGLLLKSSSSSSK
jgi:hypothetical protein